MYRWKVAGLAAATLLVLATVLAAVLSQKNNLTVERAGREPSPTHLPASSPVPQPGISSQTARPTPLEEEIPTPADEPDLVVGDYSSLEWHQDAHDPARSGYIHEEPAQPWRLLWTWNGPDPRGGAGEHFYDAPAEARTVTGGCCIFVPAGKQGLYALQKETGMAVWNLDVTAFNAAPAYDPATGYLYAGGENGILYKLEPHSGEIRGEYQAESPLNKALLVTSTSIYALSTRGDLHKVDMAEMTAVWVYSPGVAATTAPAFSSGHGLLIYTTQDLQVHAVNHFDGTARWVTNPSPLSVNDGPYTFEGYWPVVADRAGLVFVRLNLGMSALWSGPLKNNIYPLENQATRQYLEENPHLQNLFALRLEDGQPAFTPAVGYGGVESTMDGAKELVGGPLPVIRPVDDGREVAYSFFRNGQGNPPDGRWDSHIGEMVLDRQTFPEMEAGDLRFVRFENSYTHITDEQCPLSMAGDTIFHAHWGASESTRITDRSVGRGLSYNDPILTESHPVVIRRMQACASYDPRTHWTSCDLLLYLDGRTWKGPGWWVYWDVLDPPTPSSKAYSEGHLPRYTYVSDGLVILSGNGGELMVFAHSGNTP